MTTRNRKGPGSPGPVNWSEQAAHTGRLFELLDESQLPGLYQKIREVTDQHAASMGEASNAALEQLRQALDDLLAAGTPTTDHAVKWRIMRQRAVVNWMHQLAADSIQRDHKRQAGTRKPRKQELQDWITNQLRRQTGETARQLWDRAPEWITDQIGFDRFYKRTTKAKKELAASK